MIMNRLPWLIAMAMVLAAAGDTTAQETPPPELVTGTFAGSTLINTQTIEVVPKKRSFGFMIQHRFGAVGPDEQSYKQFFGLDLPANIRFSFQYALFNDMHLEIGRSKNGKTWDLSGKARLLKQTVDGAMPVSLTVFGDVALMSDDFPQVSDQMYYGDGVTPFEYRFEHRLSYNAQVIVARRFGEHFSAELAPVITYRNLVPVGGSNLTAAIALGARVKVTPKGSFLLEACPVVLGRNEEEHREPVAIGYEVATLGHVFQIVLASSPEVLEQRIYPASQSRYDEGYFHLGFNIARILYVKPKPPKP